MREVKKDYTFASGLTVAKGSFVCASAYTAHHDEHLYKNADQFNPWRFVDSDEANGNNAGASQYVSTGPGFLSFGYGRHVW
jgi:cytochrome P450